jgi:tetratricopeptide (TPR) repeat protein
MLSVRVLGPLEVTCDGEPVPLGSTRQRTLLAALLCRPNAVVSADVLREAVWPSTGTVNNLQVYIHRLRRTLRDPARIGYRAPGYLLRIERGELDATRFEDLAEQGRLREALALWRGDAFAGLDGSAFIGDEVNRLTACRRRVEADLTGRTGAVVDPAGTVPVSNIAATARRLAAAGDHRRAIAAARAALRADGRAQPLHELLGVCLREQGRYPQARRHLSMALTRSIAAGDPAAEARALQLLGIVAREEGRFAEASRLLDRAGALHHDLGDSLHEACLLLSTGELLLRSSPLSLSLSLSLSRARREVGLGLERCRELGSGFGVAYGMRLLGEVEVAFGRPGRAVPLLRQAVHLSAATRNGFLLAVALRALERAHAGAGHLTDAARARARADTIFAALGG